MNGSTPAERQTNPANFRAPRITRDVAMVGARCRTGKDARARRGAEGLETEGVQLFRFRITYLPVRVDGH
jgi:hypothetical protein